MDARLEKFLNSFNELNRENLNRLGSMYAEDIAFTDPFHEIHGLTSLRPYFDRMYKHTISSRFEWGSRLMLGNEAMVTWKMALKHRALNGAKEFWVPGASHLRFQQNGDLVEYHRDYFDVGSLLYERIPALSTIVRLIKSQV